MLDARARAAIGAPWETPTFQRFLETATAESGHDDQPIAVLGRVAVSALGARSRIVRLSGRTAGKQRRRHGYLKAEDYALVQRILNAGELFRDRNGLIGFLEEDERLRRVIVRTFNEGAEAYLNTLHRAKANDLLTTRRRFIRIEREE